jgi:hypothetical protein
MAYVARQLELGYAYNKELARQIIDQEMVKLGASQVDGIWQYEGKLVEIIVLISTEDERL